MLNKKIAYTYANNITANNITPKCLDGQAWANNVDPDQTTRMWYKIRVYTACYPVVLFLFYIYIIYIYISEVVKFKDKYSKELRCQNTSKYEN